jgi:SOS-response transcriptional repressor LexA
MDELKKELSDVRVKAENPDFSAMQQRIDNIEHISVNTIKSKADVDTVLGLIVRMDNVEGRVADLAKVTNKTALILTATMLVKDAAERGGSFVYEAEVLSELAAGNYKIDKEITIINKVAPNGINSKEELQHKFYMCPVYGQISAGQPNWAEECIEGRIPIDPELMNIINPEEYFFLRVNGESMNKVIRNGAFALIHKQDIVDDGEIAVVLVNGFDATLKKFTKQGDLVILEPQSNDDSFNTQVYDKNTTIKILGKYVGKMEINK